MSKSLRDIDLLGHYRRWREGAADFECFVRATPFVSLKHYPDMELVGGEKADEVDQKAAEVDQRIQGGLRRYFNLTSGQDTLFLVDLPGQLALSVAQYLNNEWLVKPILLFHQPLHPFGLVGDRQFIQKLLHVGQALQPIDKMRGFVLILDYQRFGEYQEVELQQYFNNQYELAEEDLPEAELLKHLGYAAVHVLTENPVKADLANYLVYLQEQGIAVKMNYYTS